MYAYKYKVLLFLFFYLLVFILYFPAQHAKFVNDTLYYLNEINSSGFEGIGNSYKMIFLWYIPSLAYYFIFTIFGFDWLGWHLVFSGLHSFNALLLVLITQKMIRYQDRWIGIIAGMFFLLSPFQTEVVAWGAALHYILIVLFLLLGILVLLKYFETKKKKFIFWFHFLFACSLSCFEQAFLFPFIFVLAVKLNVRYVSNTCRATLYKEFFYKFLTGNIVLIVLYFILTKVTYGVWIAHYGSETHSMLDIRVMYSCLMNYIWKFLFYFRYLPLEFRTWEKLSVIREYIQILCLFGFSLFLYLSYKKKWYRLVIWKSGLFFFLSFLLMLIPVLNLDQSFTFEIQSDRYGYIASVFFYPLLVLIAFQVLSRPMYYIFAGAGLLISVVLLMHSVNLWQQSGDITMKLINTYPLSAHQKSYILNLPDNYQGAYMLRNGFSEGLNVVHGNDYRQSVTIIAMVNILSNEKETETECLNDSTFYVKNSKFGKWYYYLGHGAQDYTTKKYSVDFDEWNTAYTLKIKSVQDSTYVLICEGDKWKIIDTLLQ